ncbi:MAG: methyltransferase domain-containing protein [Myxococcota bacterium]
MPRRREPPRGPWLDALLACPRCRGKLSSDGGGPHGLYRCRACGPYPRLAGVPVLVPEPEGWCSGFRDAVLASLAEVGAASADAVAVVDAFASAAPHAEARRFGDDWTAEEAGGLADASRATPSRALAALLASARTASPASWILRHAPRGGVALEVGCGAGVTGAALARRAGRLVVADVSLRAVLKARSRGLQAAGEVAGVVVDAEALPFASGAVDLLVAENLVDLLDAPADFLAEARRVLAPKGRALVTTPEPSLGTDDDGTVRALAEAAGFTVAARADGLTWVRAHSPRFVEVYVVQALAFE